MSATAESDPNVLREGSSHFFPANTLPRQHGAARQTRAGLVFPEDLAKNRADEWEKGKAEIPHVRVGGTDRGKQFGILQRRNAKTRSRKREWGDAT